MKEFLVGGGTNDTDPILSTESVRVWLIFSHDGFFSFGLVSSSVKGNPARCG